MKKKEMVKIINKSIHEGSVALNCMNTVNTALRGLDTKKAQQMRGVESIINKKTYHCHLIDMNDGTERWSIVEIVNKGIGEYGLPKLRYYRRGSMPNDEFRKLLKKAS